MTKTRWLCAAAAFALTAPLVACGSAEDKPIIQPRGENHDAAIAKLAEIQMAPDTSYLNDEERQVVNKLIEAANLMSEIYRRQVDADYDVVVIDCPPQLGFLTMSALSAATGVLVTIHPEMLDVMSMSQYLNI